MIYIFFVVNKQSIFKFSNKRIPGVPDGLAIDVNDNLWIPSFGGGQIVNIDPRRPNTVIRSIEMPIREVPTSINSKPPSFCVHILANTLNMIYLHTYS